MFGIGFTELVLISIIAILFLGPDKLPEAMVQMAKFIKSVKKTIGDAKSVLDEELKVSELKEEALSYKKELDKTTDELNNFKNIDLDDIFDDDEKETLATKEQENNSKANKKNKSKTKKEKDGSSKGDA